MNCADEHLIPVLRFSDSVYNLNESCCFYLGPFKDFLILWNYAVCYMLQHFSASTFQKQSVDSCVNIVQLNQAA